MRIYVSGPYSDDPAPNTVRALRVATLLADHYYEPAVPHLYLYWDALSPRPREYWMRLCLSQMRACDAVLRLPGASTGADIEVHYAEVIAMPVYRCINALVQVHPQGRCPLSCQGEPGEGHLSGSWDQVLSTPLDAELTPPPPGYPLNRGGA